MDCQQFIKLIIRKNRRNAKNIKQHIFVPETKYKRRKKKRYDEKRKSEVEVCKYVFLFII